MLFPARRRRQPAAPFCGAPSAALRSLFLGGSQAAVVEAEDGALGGKACLPVRRASQSGGQVSQDLQDARLARISGRRLGGATGAADCKARLAPPGLRRCRLVSAGPTVRPTGNLRGAGGPNRSPGMGQRRLGRRHPPVQAAPQLAPPRRAPVRGGALGERCGKQSATCTVVAGRRRGGRGGGAGGGGAAVETVVVMPSLKLRGAAW